ncbi:type VI secretion system tip protein VgrG [Corallincola platygyrae]|uniref:Type VI secretion system tip protein VgrG n=1 Tax=Corallincola platygyrae TaxID=1193278 RepID=A0ABW4XMM1_9GAMM
MSRGQRTLPVSQLHRELTVKVNGEPVPRSQHLLSASISAPVNKIASAKLVYQDGAAATGEFHLLNDNLFAQGNTIEILAGGSDDSTLIFSGIVVAQRIKLREDSAPQLIVTCKHAAIKATLTKNGRYFEEQSDSDIIQSLLQEYSLLAEVEATSVTHKQLVQYDCSDWDFCLQRAMANGLVIFTRGDQLEITAPDLSGDPVCNLEFGATLLSADLETDARTQASSYKNPFWDSSEQTLSEPEGESNLEAMPGNTEPSALADNLGGAEAVLRQAAEQEAEAQQQADAERQYAELSRVNGTLKSQGIATVNPGDVVQLSGLGDAFNGNALVTGVRHETDRVSGWRSYFQVGGLDAIAAKPSTKSSATAEIVSGLQIAIVVSNEDPDNEFRVKLRLPLLNNESDGIWARIASLDAGDDRGLMIRPEVDDEVIVGFVQGDPRKAVVLGMLHSSAHPAPEQPSDDNHIKLLKTRSGLLLKLDDENSELTLETPNGNRLKLTDQEPGLVLEDESDNRLVLNADGIQIESAGDISFSATGNISLEADSNIELKASANFSAEGSAGIDINSSAVTNVKGSLVKLN